MATAWPTSEPWTHRALRALVGLETTRSLKRLSAGSGRATDSGGRSFGGAGDNAKPVMSAILPSGLYRPCDAGCPRQVPLPAPAPLPRCYSANALPALQRRPGRGTAVLLEALPPHHDGAGDVDGGVGSEDDADHHREGEAPEHLAPDAVQAEDGQERGAARDERQAQGLVDRVVDDIRKRLLAPLALVIAPAIEARE